MSESIFFEHDLIKKNIAEARTYQLKIARRCLRRNSLVYLPTGLGKTVIAALVAAERLKIYPNKKVVMLSPTRPLILHHLTTFRKILNLAPDHLESLTGFVSPSERAAIWKKRVIFSTPQVLTNDILTSRINLDDISLMIFDEAHRAVGEYAYMLIAEKYAPVSDSLILGLTASLGCSKRDIEKTMQNLFIQNIEARTITSNDVKPYLASIKIEWVKIELPEKYRQVKKFLNTFISNELTRLQDQSLLLGITCENIKLKNILEMVEDFKKRDLEIPPSKRRATVIGAYAMIHGLKVIELFETQGPDAVKIYIRGLTERFKERATTSARLFLNNQYVLSAIRLTDELIESKVDHPKIPKLIELVKESFNQGSRRVIIFTNYRSTASKLVETLNNTRYSISAIRLIGYASKVDNKGLSEKAQTLILDDFKTGTYNVLIATQVGEEGLDISECDHVIFYDTVPSAIRYIQRPGRTGRRDPRKVTILIAQGTRDEAYYWISKKRERNMAAALDEITKEEKDQPPLERFPKPSPIIKDKGLPIKIIADVRESPSQVLKELSKYNIVLELKSLINGDFILSERVAVERKSPQDFASSIIDGRLFNQAADLKSHFERPILLIEGETLYISRNIKPEAVMGAVASLLIDYHLPVVW